MSDECLATGLLLADLFELFLEAINKLLENVFLNFEHFLNILTLLVLNRIQSIISELTKSIEMELLLTVIFRPISIQAINIIVILTLNYFLSFTLGIVGTFSLSEILFLVDGIRRDQLAMGKHALASKGT